MLNTFQAHEKKYDQIITGEFVVIRLDMENGKHICKLHKQPYDDVFLDSIIDTFKSVVSFIPNAVVGYTVWDEISVIWPVSSNWNQNRLLKVCSILSGYATKELNNAYRKRTTPGSVYEATVNTLYFDCRAFSISREEIDKYLKERQNLGVYGNLHWKAKQFFEDRIVQINKSEDSKRKLLLQSKASFEDDPKKYSYGVLYTKNEGFNSDIGDFRTQHVFSYRT
jgi:tRNA(His) 5'-end guanylyltransferase